MAKRVAIQLRNITKTFGTTVANNRVNLEVYNGEILSLLGENGSGKTTLMNMLAGIYFPDEGQIIIDGEEVVIRSPRDAFRYKIGMIHQHFKLVDVLSGIDNIILGEKSGYDVAEKKAQISNRDKKMKIVYDADDASAPVKAVYDDPDSKRSSVIRKLKYLLLPLDILANKIKFNWLSRKRGENIKKIAERYGFEIDLKKKIYDMSVSEKQTVEIIKVLYRGANILILDEPTAVLTPQETDKLFVVMRKMRDDGKSIIIITHKLHEVLAISDRVAVLRKGEYIGTVDTADATEHSLTEMMVGQKVELNIDRPIPQNVVDRLIVEHLNYTNRDGVKKLVDVSFTARSGEILGIAGIAGSGQRELLEAIAGLLKLDGGDVHYLDPVTGETVNLKYKTPAQIRDLGVRLSFVPEDRLGMGLVGNMDITDNMMLRSYGNGKTIFVDRKKPKNLGEQIVEDLDVVTPGMRTPVRRLSGGNIQKVLVGREIAAAPTVFMAAYPVRGLDINSSYTIYSLLNEQKESGTAVIYVGEDLDVLIELCDRIMVICGGQISGFVDGKTTTKETVGLLMTKYNTHLGEEVQHEK